MKPDKFFVIFYRRPGDDRLGELLKEPDYCRVAFATEKSLLEFRSAHPEDQIVRFLPISDASLQKKFWICVVKKSKTSSFSEQMILSTEEASDMLVSGHVLELTTGPYPTYDKASYTVDLMWEAPGDD